MTHKAHTHTDGEMWRLLVLMVGREGKITTTYYHLLSQDAELPGWKD